ncbi:MAG: glycine cleavage system aminomethyltransferase GcvT [Chloroflexi bacterium]|nr:glycine cleavage system aminomethyltransferase GcvT [Chloroflexota bacterium]
MTDEKLKKTALHATHVAAGARMVPFSGWDMPVQYPAGIIAEVNAVRNSAGIFDVSHMQRLIFEGPGTEAYLGIILSANMPAIKIGRSKYNFICNERGGIIDDALVYRTAEHRYLLVINAGNTTVDRRWLEAHKSGLAALTKDPEFSVSIVTDETAMIAIQGPSAVAIVDGLTGGEASKIRKFRIGRMHVAGIDATLARTGYTGEDGFEIIVPAEQGLKLWSLLKDAGAVECGLGARDVLRLEAGLPLHGNDLSTGTNPFEAGFDRFAYFEGPGCIAADALRRISKTEQKRQLVGFKMIGRGIPRAGLKIFAPSANTDGEKPNVIGTVTSGTHSPTVDGGIGMGYVEKKYADTGSHIVIDVRGRPIEAEIVEMPFYKREQAADSAV